MAFQGTTKFLKVVFILGCIALAIYLALQQFIRFREDADVSSISFQLFNDQPKDLYPTVTFCFSRVQTLFLGCNKGIYHQEFLSERLGIDNCRFEQVLSGKNFGPNWFNISQFLDMDINMATIRANVALTKVWSIDHTDKRAKFWDNQKNNSIVPDIPVYVSHRTPKKICFSRKTKYDVGLIRSNDVFTFNLTYLNLHGNLRLDVFVHYPGQTIRALDSFGTKKITIFPYTDDQYETWTLLLSQFNVLRKRSKPRQTCTSHLDDDTSLRDIAINRVGCVPVYWMKLDETTKHLPPCQTYYGFNQLYKLISNVPQFLTSVAEPCIRMTTQVHLEKEKIETQTMWAAGNGYHSLTIQIKYDDDMYQEIENKKEFEFKSLWCNIGGLMGIFLGVSLSQLPQLFQWFLDLFSSFQLGTFRQKFCVFAKS